MGMLPIFSIDYSRTCTPKTCITKILKSTPPLDYESLVGVLFLVLILWDLQLPLVHMNDLADKDREFVRLRMAGMERSSFVAPQVVVMIS